MKTLIAISAVIFSISATSAFAHNCKATANFTATGKDAWNARHKAFNKAEAAQNQYPGNYEAAFIEGYKPRSNGRVKVKITACYK